MRCIHAPAVVFALAFTACGGEDSDPGSANACGGLLGVVCQGDEYCDLNDPRCQTADDSGICRARPSACPDIYMPVIGSDGQIYGNACDAHANGVDDCGAAP